MKHKLELAILPQPNATTCGPTCLHAMYRYLGDELPLETLIDETHKIESAAGGGTYSVFLGIHALRRGYRATIHTFNLRVFDPTWFALSKDAMVERLCQRRDATIKPRLRMVMQGFLDFLDLGGELQFDDLTTGLIRRYLNRGIPILTGLSSTYLYRTMRERSVESPDGSAELVDDDVRGDPQGHFVVLCGYDKSDRSVLVADPWTPNPAFQGLQYVVNIDRVLCSILLGALTNDADLLTIEHPSASPPTRTEVDTTETSSGTQADSRE